MKNARRLHSAFALLTIAAAASPAPLAAQESQTSPPPPLQFPYQADTSAIRGVALIFLRNAIESAADLALCNALMQNDGKTVPANFTEADCLPEYRAKVKANEGAVHWASNARPLSCGDKCFGRPFMTQQQNLNRPNLRQAQIFGWLNFTLDGPATANRSLSYPYSVFLTCKAENGARTGNLNLQIKFDPPVIGSPGLLESFISELFSLGELSRYIDREIKNRAPGIPSLSLDQGPCKSVGPDRATDPKFDMVRYDPAPSGPGAVRGAAAIGIAGASALKDTVRVELISIKRNPLPQIVDPAYGRPGDPFAAQFQVYFNGEARFLPAANLALPPEGGTVAAHFCKTVDVSGYDRLQLIFANDLGGAAWSEFTRGGKFGEGLHTITTGRTIILPATQGPSNPVTGRPTINKPQPFPLREFELTYRITYQPSPATTGAVASETAPAAPAAPSGSAGSTTKPRGAFAGRVARSRIPEVLAADPSRAQTTPCVEL